MKQIPQVVAIFFLLFTYSIASARMLPLLSGNEPVKAIETTTTNSPMHVQEDDTFNVMGLEEVDLCEEKDETCVKRRITAEAHLDYIYTQHKKPQKAKP